MSDLTLLSHHPDETIAFAEAFATVLEPGNVIGLIGDLGAGKTRFVQGVATGIKVSSEEVVCSPTFTLINEYDGPIRLIHVDLYRLTHPRELIELGLEDYYGGECVCLVEWFDRFPSMKPREYVEITISTVEAESTWRRIDARAEGERHARLLERWQRAL